MDFLKRIAPFLNPVGSMTDHLEKASSAPSVEAHGKAAARLYQAEKNRQQRLTQKANQAVENHYAGGGR